MPFVDPDSECSLTWGVLQERITTTNYGTEKKPEVFKYPVVMNTVQSTFAALLGYGYVLGSRRSSSDLPIFPSRAIVWPLVLVAITSAVSSPFGYASLQHVDYITFILAKSCKLLPVMLLHVTLYRRKYPFYKYAVVALVTSGVAIFTVYQSGGSKKKKGADGNSLYGLMLLGINLLFDGLTNSTQDDIYARFRPYTGQQMMCALNMMSTVLTSCFLLLSPYIVQSGLGAQFGMDSKGAGELCDALAFIQRHPAVGWDILGFAACGALGQVFICSSTLSIFVFLSADIENSHDPLHLRQPPPRHGDSHEKNAHNDHLGRLVRPFSNQHAMARCRSRLRRHWDRSRTQ
jgi:solute carrier family 35 (UDP-galactose transporter), member B1